LVEDIQLLPQNSLWSSLNQHSRGLPISKRHELQLLDNLGNVSETIDPRAGFQSLWSSLNHQIGLWSSLNHHHHSVCGHPKTKDDFKDGNLSQNVETFTNLINS
jgi:hypothetical protein